MTDRVSLITIEFAIERRLITGNGRPRIVEAAGLMGSGEVHVQKPMGELLEEAARYGGGNPWIAASPARPEQDLSLGAIVVAPSA